MSPTFTAFRALVSRHPDILARPPRLGCQRADADRAVAAFFGFLFGGTGRAATQSSRMKVGITDLDQSALTTAVLESLKQDASLEIHELPEEQALQLVRSGKLRAAIVFPANFEAAATGALVGSGAMPDVKLLYDPSQPMVRPMRAGLLSQHVISTVVAAEFRAAFQGPSPFNVRQCSRSRADLDTTPTPTPSQA